MGQDASGDDRPPGAEPVGIRSRLHSPDTGRVPKAPQAPSLSVHGRRSWQGGAKRDATGCRFEGRPEVGESGGGHAWPL